MNYYVIGLYKLTLQTCIILLYYEGNLVSVLLVTTNNFMQLSLFQNVDSVEH